MKTLDEYMELDYRMLVETVHDEGDTYYAISYPDLPGLIIYSDDKLEGLEEIEEAKKEWFAAALDTKVRIPEPVKESDCSGRITLRIPKQLHEEIRTKASINGISLNLYVNHLIEQGLRGFDLKTIENQVKQMMRGVSSSVENISTTISSELKKEEVHFHITENQFGKSLYNINTSKSVISQTVQDDKKVVTFRTSAKTSVV
ncbi:toxin-antitoxin system HicB family antitoxin [Enterococcus sp. BWR-S5]|uniref:toxin-antitoxin system HicB family antitoxin n=1 Tax=Enterococcus sp. BWR-S5 TaxID=2787714 RepID=UPI0019209C6B|nr:toxin-antitoxin system HicB family antitoxin [Enterococcus sp. BWR-S5]MBL1224777.1 toxin-antitoxin system HicB family antitoxin [Enterococcus sp. BWR-S5]